MTKERNHFCLGKYVPAISYKIHKMNQDPQTSTINLKGLAIGDGLTDPIHQMSYGDFLFQTGLGSSCQLLPTETLNKILSENLNT